MMCFVQISYKYTCQIVLSVYTQQAKGRLQGDAEGKSTPQRRIGVGMDLKLSLMVNIIIYLRIYEYLKGKALCSNLI